MTEDSTKFVNCTSTCEELANGWTQPARRYDGTTRDTRPGDLLPTGRGQFHAASARATRWALAVTAVGAVALCAAVANVAAQVWRA